MPTLSRTPIEITAPNMGGRYITHAEKSIRPQDVYRGQNWRQNKDGGRYPRPGYSDSGIDYSSFAFTAGRGQLSAKYPVRMWLAGDDGAHVKITYVDTNINNPQYGQVFDCGLTLTTGKYVHMKEILGDIYYANGADTVGRIVTAEVATGGVASGATELNLKGGRGVLWPATGSGRIGDDTFTWGGKTADQLTTVSGLTSDHLAGELIILTTTYSPDYEDKASMIEEWLGSLNLAGDPEQPFLWEFSKFANAGAPENFYTFSDVEPEMVGAGGVITGFLATKNFFYVWKEDSLHATGRTEVDADTGARPPQPIEGASGNVNPRTVTQAGKGGDAYYQTPSRHFVKLGIRIEQGGATVGLDDNFDSDLDGIRSAMDLPSVANWSHYNSQENFLKFRVFESAVSVVYVWDFNVGTFYRDTNKNYDCVCQHVDGKTWAFDGSAGKMYIDETGNADDDLPVTSYWETGRLGREEFLLGKARFVHMHGYMTQGSINYIDFYKDNKYQFTKVLDETYIISLQEDEGVQIGTQGIGNSSFGSGGGGPIAFPFRFPIGAYHRGEDYKLKVRSLGENGEFVQYDGFTIGVTPLDRSPYRHA